MRSPIYRAWIASGLVAFACFVASSTVGRGLLVVTGLIILGWGLALATNWRGAADRMPKSSGIGRFQVTQSQAMVRLTFAFFALWGAGVFVAGVLALVR
jgi:hypothetical protein